MHQLLLKQTSTCCVRALVKLPLQFLVAIVASAMGDSAKDEVTLDTVRWISLLNTDMWKAAGFGR